MKCTNCYSNYDDSLAFCPYCGEKNQKYIPYVAGPIVTPPINNEPAGPYAPEALIQNSSQEVNAVKEPIPTHTSASNTNAVPQQPQNQAQNNNIPPVYNNTQAPYYQNPQQQPYGQQGYYNNSIPPNGQPYYPPNQPPMDNSYYPSPYPPQQPYLPQQSPQVFIYNGNTPPPNTSSNVPPNYNNNIQNNMYNNGNYPYKNKMVALILCIVAGYLGVHYFYVGRIGMGLLYLFTGGLCGVGWLIDIVRILTGNFKDSNGQPLV